MTTRKAKARATRREFIATATAVAAAAMWRRGLFAQGMSGLADETASASTEETELEAKLAGDPERPQFHLLPAKNWMNDPNGPIYFNGFYHMFFQYDPLAATWGDMSWGHAISRDMLHWTHLPIALTPTPGSADSFGCFSGSAIAVGERVYVVYTGTKESTPEMATIRDGSNKIQEAQCLAWSDDPKLVAWTKDPEPIVARPPAGMDVTGFRDPSAWKQGEWYYMTVGSGVARVGGCVLLYRSKDLKSWEYLHELTSGEWSGVVTANPCDDGQMWECPELFPLGDAAKGGGHVLIYSTLGKVFWESGALDEATMKFTSHRKGLLDLDAFYAPKTQHDEQGRRVLWGWIPERRPQAAMREAGWSGMMSLPRVLTLDADGALRMQVLPQVSGLRGGAVSVQKSPSGLKTVLPKANGEVAITADKGGPLELTMSDGTNELMQVSYSAERHAFTADGKEIPLEAADVPRLHAFVDGSVIELMLSERIGYTKRFYYPGRTAPDIAVKATGRGLRMNAWIVTPISRDRLTTPAATG